MSKDKRTPEEIANNPIFTPSNKDKQHLIEIWKTGKNVTILINDRRLTGVKLDSASILLYRTSTSTENFLRALGEKE